jgi:hypothetical protein
MANTITADEIRENFSQAMSAMYQQEVPQYGTLLELVADVNLAVLENNPSCMNNWRMPMSWRGLTLSATARSALARRRNWRRCGVCLPLWGCSRQLLRSVAGRRAGALHRVSSH